MLRVLFTCALLWCLSKGVLAAPPSTSVEFVDLQGRTQSPLAMADHKATILFFVLPDCPISNAYAPEVNRIVTEYAKQDIAAFIVYVDPDLSLEDAKKHATDFGYTCPVLLDPSLKLVKQTGVTIAPEVTVLGPDGRRHYRGRIDNLYAGLGKRRPKATERDLRDALDAIVAGKPVPHATTTAIGCYIAKPSDTTKSTERSSK